MSGTRAGVRTLGGLRDKLDDGVATCARLTQPKNWKERASDALTDWPGDRFDEVARLREGIPEKSENVEAVISLLASKFHDRALLTAVLFSPELVLDKLLVKFGSRAPDSWIAMLWTAVAASDVVAGDLLPGDEFGVLDAELLRPLAARLLFLVASEPMRTRQQGEVAWWGGSDGADLVFGYSGLLGRAFGDDSWYLVAARAQKARREWLGCLAGYQSHPFLAQARPAELEQELRLLAFRRRRLGRPLSLSVSHLQEPAVLTAEDRTVLDDLTSRHFLPRFDLLSTASLACSANTAAGSAARLTVAAAAIGLGVAAATFAGELTITQAARLDGAFLAVVAVGVVVFGRSWAATWLLRFPAAATIGVIALISLAPGGWITSPPGGWRAAVVLMLAAFGYLLVEARNHGVAGRVLVLRSFAVALAGFLYGLMVALIGLVYVAPAFVPGGSALTALWDHPTYARAGLALWLAASWCLAVGVFSQILWDDRPITAPLAHLTWNRTAE
jgi:hypothetical protein